MSITVQGPLTQTAEAAISVDSATCQSTTGKYLSQLNGQDLSIKPERRLLFHLLLPSMNSAEGQVLNRIGAQINDLIPVSILLDSQDSSYWGGIEELLGNVRDFLEEVRLTQWPIPLFRQVIGETYLMTVQEQMLWMQAYLKELQRLQEGRLRQLRPLSLWMHEKLPKNQYE